MLKQSNTEFNVAKRAKRASRTNPREDRNDPQKVSTNRARNTRSTQDNASQFKQKKNIEIIPRSINQEDLLTSLNDDNKSIVFAIGPAGSGKTLISTLWAIKALKEGRIKKIVISRPNIAVDDKDIGYLPGDILSKMAPWIRPITAEMEEYFTKQEIEQLITNEVIEIVPIAFMRGRTFKNSVILLDEAQNTTPNSLLSAMTRIGEGSKMIITGDIKQSDRRGSSNGLSDFVGRYEGSSTKMMDVIRFNDKDVQRHPVIKDILSMYKDIDL